MKGLDLKIMRENAGLTQKELGSLLGKSGRTVISWEKSEILSQSQVKLIQSVFNDVKKQHVNEDITHYVENTVSDLGTDSDQNINIDGVDLPIKSISQAVIDNQKLFFNEEYFSMWFEKKVRDELKAILEQSGVKVTYSAK